MNENEIPAIEIKDLSVTLNGIHILQNISASIMRNEITAIIGPNGAGKTTILLAIMHLIPYTGSIIFSGENKLGREKPHIGYVPQHLDLDRGTPVTVLDFLSLSEQKLPLWLGHRKHVKDKIITNLDRVKASHLSKRPLGKLSGGELQRVLLAMAIKDDPDIVLLDEPVSGIDVAGEELFSELLTDLQREKRFTLALISHDLSVVTKHADHVICLNKTLRCEGKIEVLTPENLAAIYGIDKGLYKHGGQDSHHEHALK